MPPESYGCWRWEGGEVLWGFFEVRIIMGAGGGEGGEVLWGFLQSESYAGETVVKLVIGFDYNGLKGFDINTFFYVLLE